MCYLSVRFRSTTLIYTNLTLHAPVFEVERQPALFGAFHFQPPCSAKRARYNTLQPAEKHKYPSKSSHPGHQVYSNGPTATSSTPIDTKAKEITDTEVSVGRNSDSRAAEGSAAGGRSPLSLANSPKPPLSIPSFPTELVPHPQNSSESSTPICVFGGDDNSGNVGGVSVTGNERSSTLAGEGVENFNVNLAVKVSVPSL